MTQSRAVFFLAVSSGAQAADDKESLPEQRRQLDEAAARHGWRVVDTITVPGFSRDWYTVREFSEAAAAAGMPDALRLFDHWSRRDFDVLAALNTTRLGRDQSILAEVIRRTIDAGAVVYTVKDGFIDAQNQRMHIAMSGYATGAEIDELRRRIIHHMGYTLTNTRRYSGLCVCGLCGRGMGYNGVEFVTLSGQTNRYLRCYVTGGDPCSNAVREDELTDGLNALLEAIVRTGLLALRPAGTADLEARARERRAAVESEKAATEAAIRTLIGKQAAAPASLSAFYDDELASLAARLAALGSELARLEPADVPSLAQRQIVTQLQAGGPAWFWAQPDREQNQLLGVLLGMKRLVIVNRHIVGVAPYTRKPKVPTE